MGVLDAIFKRPPAIILQSNPTDLYVPALGLAAAVNLNMAQMLPQLREYMPLNWVEVYNPSTTTLTVRLESNGGEMFRVETGSSRIIRASFNNLVITNIGGFALAANTAILTVQRV